MNTGQQIREKREEKGLKQQELADKLHISRQSLSHWETNHTQPNEENILLLCDILETTRENLLEQTLEMDAKEPPILSSISKKDDTFLLIALLILGLLLPGLGIVLISHVLKSNDKSNPRYKIILFSAISSILINLIAFIELLHKIFHLF